MELEVASMSVKLMDVQSFGKEIRVLELLKYICLSLKIILKLIMIILIHEKESILEGTVCGSTLTKMKRQRML